MAVSKRIFRRKDRKAWYCKVDGKFVNLGSDKSKAEEKSHELCAHDEPGTVSRGVDAAAGYNRCEATDLSKGSPGLVRKLAQAWVDWAERTGWTED